MKPCIETSCFVSILFLLMEFNYPYWLVANSQAGQAWNAANQPNMGSVYPYPSYHSQWQPESHPTTHLGSSWHSLPPGQLRQIRFIHLVNPSTPTEGSSSQHSQLMLQLQLLAWPLLSINISPYHIHEHLLFQLQLLKRATYEK